MKKFFLILLFIPLITLADQPVESKNMQRLKQLCKDTTDPHLRETYCTLVEKQKKGEAVMEDFQKINP